MEGIVWKRSDLRLTSFVDCSAEDRDRCWDRLLAAPELACGTGSAEQSEPFRKAVKIMVIRFADRESGLGGMLLDPIQPTRNPGIGAAENAAPDAASRKDDELGIGRVLASVAGWLHVDVGFGSPRRARDNQPFGCRPTTTYSRATSEMTGHPTSIAIGDDSQRSTEGASEVR